MYGLLSHSGTIGWVIYDIIRVNITCTHRVNIAVSHMRNYFCYASYSCPVTLLGYNSTFIYSRPCDSDSGVIMKIGGQKWLFWLLGRKVRNGLFDPGGDRSKETKCKMTTIFYRKKECLGEINESEVEMVRNFSIFLDLVN